MRPHRSVIVGGIAVVAVVFAIVVGFLHDQTIVVRMTRDGFSPPTVSIPAGTTVVFRNDDTVPRWPAGNDHPSHTLYDGSSLADHCGDTAETSFDACRAIAPGEEWTFVFKKAGTVAYHDHLAPHYGGVIEVIGNRNKASMRAGSTETSEYEAQKDYFQQLVEEGDPRAAIDDLRAESEANSKTLALCHDYLHAIGKAAYEKYGSFEKALQYQSDFCNSGYIHGIFESYLTGENRTKRDLEVACSEYAKGRRPFDLWQCYHGIGHGFMYWSSGDLDLSLQSCESLGQAGASSCQNGAYMEIFNAEILAKESSYVTNSDPFATCASRALGKGDCYLYVPTYLSQTLHIPYKEMFDRCGNAEEAHEEVCIEGIGAEAMKRNMNEPVRVLELCAEADTKEHVLACQRSAIGMYMNQKGSRAEGALLCAALPAQFREMCSSVVAEHERFFAEVGEGG